MPVSYVGAIRSILDLYPFSKGLFREILQNSEDANATTQIFVLDHRTHGGIFTNKSSATGIQGPSLLAYNNSVFTDRDFESLFNIYESSKTLDTSKIGKFGMGFRSNFHVTDTPQVLSESTLAILDPLMGSYETEQIKLDLAKEPRRAELLAPFALDIFQPGWTIHNTFPGSVVRLPLRTTPSRISRTTVSTAEIQQLLVDFSKEEIRIALLFLKNISSIEIYEIDAAGTRTCLAKSSIIRSVGAPYPTISADITIFSTDAVETTTLRTPAGPSVTERWRILQASFTSKKAASDLSHRLGFDATDALSDHKLHPTLALAIPLSVLEQQNVSSTFGRLFTYLPLPLMTQFCVHVHGLFALTPSREKLQNREETPAHGSDYHISVEWNKLLFEEYLPRAWMYLLWMLKDEGIKDIFMAWPPAQSVNQLGDSGYWEQLPSRLLEHMIKSNSRVWPIVGMHTSRTNEHLDIESVLIATANEDEKILHALAACGLKITRPPKYVAQILKDNPSVKVLSPASVYASLLENSESLSSLFGTDKTSLVLRYLISTANIEHIIGLPVIPTSNDRYISLSRRDGSSILHTMLEVEEFKVFGAREENAIALHRFEPSVAELLKRHGPSILNVQLLTPAVVVGYLEVYPQAPGFVPGTSKLEGSVVSWLLQFWNWMKGSALNQQLYPLIEHLPLLPTQDGLKPTNSPIFEQAGMHPSLLSNLKKLRVLFFHQDFGVPNRRILDSFRKISNALDLHDILDALTYENIAAFEPDSGAAVQLVKHVKDHHGSLNEDQRHKLRLLPIFPLAVAPRSNYLRHRTRVPDGQRAVGAIVSDLRTLPSIQGIMFLDGNEMDLTLVQMLDPTTQQHLLDVDILRMGLEHFMAQSSATQDAFVNFMALYKSKVPGELLDKLGVMPFVSTSQGVKRSPNDLVDPKSSLEPLFAKDSVFFPQTQSQEEKKLVNDLRLLKLMQTTLSTAIVKERIRFISDRGDREVARRLLKIMYETRFRLTEMPEIHLKWLPTPKGLLSPDECRDEPHRKELFDHVLAPLDSDIKTDRSLRVMFRWDQPLPVTVLIKQLSHMLSLPEGNTYRSIYSIVKELIDRSHSRDDVATLRVAISGRPWIPVSDVKQLLVTTEHAVFSGEAPSVGFYPIPFAGSKAVAFFTGMGCSNVPSTHAILGQLKLLQTEAPSKSVADKALHLLRLLPSNMDEKDRIQILVPDISYSLRSLFSVFYNDIGEGACLVDLGNSYLAYSKIDDELAKFLRLDRLGLKFVDFTPLGHDMGEELTTTIRNKLKSYTTQQILTEFLANAADAGATNFGILIDEIPAPSGRILTEKMSVYQKYPSVVIYNDARFTSADFKGICQTGIGGKVARSDSIGQFGFGALTMFHLTDLAMIVSGDQVLFLNPAKRDLPIAGRATLPLPLNHMKRFYPGHLAPLDGIFGFELSSSEPYHGTLFRLPLRQTEPVTTNALLGGVWTVHNVLTEIVQPFADSGEEFMLFSRIRNITVNHRNSRGLRCQWETTAAYEHEHTVDKNRSKIIKIAHACHREIRSRTKSQKWHVVSTSLPDQNILSHSLADKYRVRLPIELALAAQVGGSDSPAKHKFFSTLPLAKTSSLPVHLTAPFILSDDRRQIRLDEYDAAVSDFNRWLLSTAMPPLYMFLLADLLRSRGDNLSWWPGDTDKEDEITSLMTTSFYGTYLKPTDQRVFHRLYDSSGDCLLPQDAVVMDPCQEDKLDKVLRLVKPRLASLRPRVALQAIEGAGITPLTPTYLKALILRSSNPAPHLKFKDLNNLFVFLCRRDSDDILGLPLLPLANKTFAILEETGDISRTYFIAHRNVHDLFPANRHLVHQDFSVTSLLSSSINIHRLNGPAVGILLTEVLGEADQKEIDDRTQKWITTFWRDYLYLSATQVDIAAFPLVPTTRPGCYTSINNCKKRSAVVFSDAIADGRVWQSLTSLGLTVVDRHAPNFPSHLRQILSGNDFPDFAFQHLLSAIAPIQGDVVDRFNQLDSGRRTLVSGWCQNQVTNVPTHLIPVARRLPIWPAMLNQVSVLRPADQITMLPPTISMNIAGRFMSAPVSAYSASLTHIQVKALTFPEFFSSLELPPILPIADIEAYKRLLQMMFAHNHSSFDTLRVPNRNRILMRPKDLYARDPLFAAAFEGSPDFVLEAMQDIEPDLGAFKLKRETPLDFETFRACARAIHDTNSENVVDPRRARIVFEAYSEELPLRINSRQQDLWPELDNLRFIPRAHARRNSMSGAMDLSVYTKDLPNIVSPSELLLPKFEPIAWTQRALFLVQPNERVLLAYPALGRPTFTQVVAHLRVLALRVLQDYPSNPRMHDLAETYKWLNENCDSSEASGLLLQHHSEPLFLNVTDPFRNTGIEWHSADQLLLGESKVVAQYHPVRAFLLPFKNLLRKSGVRNVIQPELPKESDLASDSAQLASLREIFLEMRRTKKLTDVEFDAGDDDEEILPGHRAFLATYSTFFYDAFTNSMDQDNRTTSVSNPKIINVKEYTSCCVSFALDFAYTGTLPDVNQEDCLSLLLEVIMLSNYWQMGRLHDETQRLIIRMRLIDAETCTEIQSVAKEHQADLLARACQEYQEKNRDIIRSIVL